MRIALLFSKTSSEVLVWIAIVLGLFVFLWAVGSVVQWIASKPWNKPPRSSEENLTEARLQRKLDAGDESASLHDRFSWTCNVAGWKRIGFSWHRGS